MISARVIDDFDHLRNLRDQWEVLLDRSLNGTVFQSYEWISNWWKRFGFGKKLFVVAVSSSDSLVGLALFMIVVRTHGGITIRSLHFCGETGSRLCPDHLDVIASPGFEEQTVDVVINKIFSNTNAWDMVSLSSIAHGSVLYKRMLLELDNNHYSYGNGVSCEAPFLELPSRSHKNWKDKLKKLSKTYLVTTDILMKLHDVEHGLAITKQLVGASAMRKNHLSSWDDEEYANFHLDVCRELADKIKFNVAVLYCNDLPVAVLYGYVVKNKYLMYSIGLDSDYGKFSAGQILIGKFIEYLTENRIAEFDFLRGDEDYKYRWTDTSRQNNYINIFNKTIRGTLLYAIIKSRKSIGQLIKNIYRNYCSS